jgi:hypothetical protein
MPITAATGRGGECSHRGRGVNSGDSSNSNLRCPGRDPGGYHRTLVYPFLWYIVLWKMCFTCLALSMGI